MTDQRGFAYWRRDESGMNFGMIGFEGEMGIGERMGFSEKKIIAS